MKYYLILFFTSLLCLMNCSIKKNVSNNEYEVKLDTLTLFDPVRNRSVPVAFYTPKTDKVIPDQQLVIFNHGYGANKGGDYFVYSYLTEKLASKGYFVVSIQHELLTDDLLPVEGNLQIVRRPFWQRGADNILFVLQELKKIKPRLDYKHLALIGHSNGGDMVALFGNQHPSLADKIITMDNRRMFLPRTSIPKIYSLRSNDYPADEGVLPTEEEQKKYHIIIQPTDINHNHMDNKGNNDEKKILNNYILSYLDEK